MRGLGRALAAAVLIGALPALTRAEDAADDTGEVTVPVGALATTEDGLDPVTARDPILDYLRRAQHPDGSWGEDPLATDSRAAATALAVLACCHAGFGPEHHHRYDHMLQRGLMALLALDRGDATWSQDDTVQAQACDALCTCLHLLKEVEEVNGADGEDERDPNLLSATERAAQIRLLQPRCEAAVQALQQRRTALVSGAAGWCGSHPGSCDTDTMLWCLAALASATQVQLAPADPGTGAWFDEAVASANDPPSPHPATAASAEAGEGPLRFPAAVVVVGGRLRASRASATAEGIICGVLLNLPTHVPVMRRLAHRLRHDPVVYDALDCLCRSFCIVNLPGQAGSAGALEDLLGARRSLDAATLHSWPSDRLRHGVTDDRVMTTCLVSLMRDVAGSAGDWHP